MLRFASLLLCCISLPESFAAEAPAPMAGLEYRLIGPTVGGRITKVSGVSGDPMTWYLGAAQGGVWKSEDGGHEWRPIFDKMPSNSVGSLAVAAADANVIYVGGGEANIRGNVQPGQGLFVSTDAGKNWRHTLKLRGAIGDIEVDPYLAETAFAAVLGNPFKSNPERGVYRTTDAGQTWEQVLHVDADTGASDIAIDANNTRIVWAGTWQARRTPWGLTSGGPGSGLWRSADGGDTWTRLAAGEHGLPKGDWGKVGVAVSPADGERIYALIEAQDGGLYRSDDGGEKFERINDHWVLRQRAWYYTTIVPDPNDVDSVWFPQVPMLYSADGGKTLQQIEGFGHGDHHDLWIDPADSQRMIAGNDGGVDLSFDGGYTWRAPSLPLGQFYNIDVDQRQPYHVGGTLQDQGTVSGPALSLRNGASELGEWTYVGGGEAGDFRYDLAQPGTVYAGEYGGYLTRYVEGSGQYRNISAVPANPSGVPPQAMRERFQWTAPLELSPHDPATIYHGANVLFRSRDRGENWQAISPDLTRNDKSKQQWSGGPITGDNTGVEIYGTIFSIDESPLSKGEIWVGSDDGRVHLSVDDGASWKDVTPRDLGVDTTVESLRASRHVAGRVYLVAHRYRLGDDRPLVYVSDDRGGKWRSLAGSLPPDMPLYSIAEDEHDPALLYLGGERAIYASTDGGKHWQPIQLNLPSVAVVDLETAHNDLILGTRGRGLYVFHDLAALRSALGAPASPQLLAPAEAIRWRSEHHWGLQQSTENADYGAVISYYLPSKVDGEIKLRVVDSSGALVRELSSVAKPDSRPLDDPDDPREAPKPELATETGWHRVAWDLRHTGASLLDHAKIDAGNPETGPLAIPGSYRVELSGLGQALQAPLLVKADPRSPADQAAMAAQLGYALELREGLESARAGIEWVRAANAQAADLSKRLGDAAEHQAIVAAATAVIADAERIEGELHNPEAKVVYDILRGPRGAQLYSQLAPLYSWSQDSDLAPSAAMLARWNELKAQLTERERAIAAMNAGSVATLEAAVSNARLPRLILPTLKDTAP